MFEAVEKQVLSKRPSFQVPNLERGLQVLEYLVGQEGGISLTGLARALGFPQNSLARIMNALQYYGYVERDPATKEYTLSYKLFAMGFQGAHARNLMECSLDVMRFLRDACGETVVVSIIDGDHGLVLEQVQGTHSFRFVCDPGTRQMLHCSASCKAILAFRPEAERERIMAAMDFQACTSTTIRSKKAFLKELETVRARGYALDRAEAIDGVHCVASPVRDRTGMAVAAITVTGPSNRMSLASMDGLGELVAQKTVEISKRMGYVGKG